MTLEPGCTYQVEDNPDNAPRYCGKPVVAVWQRWGYQRGEYTPVHDFPRCRVHDDTMDRAVGLLEDYSREER